MYILYLFDNFLFLDTTAPTIELLKPLPTKTKQPTWTFLWTADELTNFTCAIDSLRNEVDCGFGMNGRFTTEPLADGRHRLYLLGQDELGNTARVVTHSWVVGKLIELSNITEVSLVQPVIKLDQKAVAFGKTLGGKV